MEDKIKLSIKQDNSESFISRVIYYLSSVSVVIIIFLVALFFVEIWSILAMLFCFSFFFILRAMYWAKYNILSITICNESLYISYCEFNSKKEKRLKLEDTTVEIKYAFVKGGVGKLVIISNIFSLTQYESRFWDEEKMNDIVKNCQ